MQKIRLNPWVTMWNSPQNTIRAVVDSNPMVGFFYLGAISVLQSFFFLMTYYSIYFPFQLNLIVLIVAIVLSPFIGAIWLYFMGWLLYFTGRWLGSKAIHSHVRACFNWSRIPLIINLLMWFFLAAFISSKFLADSPMSLFFINFISLITGIWSFVLLIQSLREIQLFSVIRSIVNIILSYLVLFIILFVFAFILSLINFI